MCPKCPKQNYGGKMNTLNRPEIVCPKCGTVEQIICKDRSGTINCECGCKYIWHRHPDYLYSTIEVNK
jgi:hypothetical protein